MQQGGPAAGAVDRVRCDGDGAGAPDAGGSSVGVHHRELDRLLRPDLQGVADQAHDERHRPDRHREFGARRDVPDIRATPDDVEQPGLDIRALGDEGVLDLHRAMLLGSHPAP